MFSISLWAVPAFILNEYIIAYVMLSSADKQTITIWLANFTTDTTRGVDWGALKAAATLTALPVVLFFVIVHRRIACKPSLENGYPS